jgi:hypothetical protein
MRDRADTAVRPEWEHEWRDAAAVDLAEAPDRRPRALLGMLVVAAAVVAGLLPALFPLSPGYSMRNTTAQVVAAVIAAAAAVGIVPLAALVVRTVSRRGLALYSLALLSAGAAAIHFAVAKGHFDEYFLFGLFFVLSGLAQLVWAALILFKPSRLFLALGAIGNLLIVALWGVDRIWGLPIGPEHWKPEPVGFSDVAASAFEVVLVVGCIALLAHVPRLRGATRARRGLAFALTIAVVALTTMSLLSAVGIGSPLITPSA